MRGTLFLLEEFDKAVGQLVPQLTLPRFFEVEKVVLEIVRSSIALLGEEVWYRVNVHDRVARTV